MTIQDIIKIVGLLISWPVVGAIAILIFRKPLSVLLSRESVKMGFGKEGVTLAASAAAATNQAESKPVGKGLADPETEKRLQAVRNIDVVPIVQEQANLIRADLQKLNVSQQEQIELLVKHLAVTQLWLRAEYTYRTIFGSQIALLKFLNTTGAGTRAQLLQFYETAKLQFPELYTGYSFEQYLHYLVSQSLIAAQDPDRYVITVAGKEFLKWLAESGLVENKTF
jgi:hypothetical protein